MRIGMKAVRGSVLFIAACAVMITINFDGCRKTTSLETPPVLQKPDLKKLTVIAFNDLGMHCLNQDFSEFMILPPYNTLHAQVFDRSDVVSRIVTDDIIVRYSVPGNTFSVGKTNFWTYAQSLFGKTIAPNMGLAGKGLSGVMDPTGNADFVAAGIPLTPLTDKNEWNPFQLALIQVLNENNHEIVRTQTVVPVSWELRCDLCHHGAPDAPASVLDAHDQLHGTHLYNPTNQTPVVCGQCHAQPELGLPGQQGRNSLSRSMHLAHSTRMMDVVDAVPNGNICYACHPGLETQCLRDVHAMKGMNCADCHAGGTKDNVTAMLAIADASRTPWVTLPRCDNCHKVPGHSYEQAGLLFKNSRGHGGAYCEACHNSTHAVTPAMDAPDNAQSMLLQNSAGAIKDCLLCHKKTPDAPFRHQFIQPAS